jgi:two-component system, OmpR family, phosphate regulon sensor histidine kinase PhoR
MSPTANKYAISQVLFLFAGALLGWYYDRPLTGLLVASLLCMAWQTRQLLQFERALRTDNFDKFRYGDGLWEQLFSRVKFDRERGKRRKAAYRNLLREVRKSTDAMPDGAVILDASNEILACNRAASTLVGLKRKKDRGQRIDNILRDQRLTALIGNDVYDQSVEIRSPVNDDEWLNCRVVPYGADQKLLLIRDITESTRLNKMRRDFVANASHELRSPLTVISGYLDALADDNELPSQWQKPVDQMQSQSVRMQQILAELMELSRLENEQSATRDNSIEVAALIDRVVQALPRDDNQARIEVAEVSNAKLLGVEPEIESVLANLLSNALRYTPADGRISVSWVRDQAGASLIVEDTGIGIEARHLHRLTERFFRVDRGRSRDDGGVGLGLAIVKHVLARHDAELDISSDPGSGSRFSCLFPEKRLGETVS